MKWYIRWLRKPLWRTGNMARADRSPFMWVCSDDECTLSLLGIINGILPLVGLVLIDHDSRLSITKVWW